MVPEPFRKRFVYWKPVNGYLCKQWRHRCNSVECFMSSPSALFVKQEGPWVLVRSPESLSRGEDVYHKSHSPTPKSILGITKIITKAYQVTKFNQIILICTISMSAAFYPTQKIRGVHNVKHFNCIM